MAKNISSDTPTTGDPKLAIVYLPPILNANDSDELGIVGHKLAESLDKFAADNAAVFTANASIGTTRNGPESICRINMSKGPNRPESPLADLFLLDYRPKLMARYRDAPLWRRVLQAAIGVVVMFMKGSRALLRQPFRVKLLRDRTHALYALACVGIVFFYLFLLLATSVIVIADGIRHNFGTTPKPALHLGAETNHWIQGSQGWAHVTNTSGESWLIHSDVKLAEDTSTNSFLAATNWGLPYTNQVFVFGDWVSPLPVSPVTEMNKKVRGRQVEDTSMVCRSLATG